MPKMPSHTDITLPPDLHRKSGTGPVRLQQPVYVNSLPPCNHACPAGEDIQGWLDKAQAGEFEAAWRLLVRDNPLPAVHGRVCYHPCESACNRSHVDDAVSIHAVERFLGDLAIEHGWVPLVDAEPTGRSVLVIGAGPSGLSAAWHLAQMGHRVEIREAGPMAGGMMRYGIPAYRMPRDMLDAEVARIEQLGVKIILDHKVEDVLVAKTEGGFDAVFMAIGAHIWPSGSIFPPAIAGKILDAVSFLEQAVEAGDAPKLGRRVAIYGGGNTAMDAARTAKRLGAEEAMIIYRRDREHMPAHDFEATEAEEEGIKINWLRTIAPSTAPPSRWRSWKWTRRASRSPPASLKPSKPIRWCWRSARTSTPACIARIPGVSISRDGVVEVGPNMMTGAEGVFAGGDMVPSERTVTIATGHGKKAARHIDAWLRGTAIRKRLCCRACISTTCTLHYHTDAQQQQQSILPPLQRTRDFHEVTAGLTRQEALFEAARCYSCGNCFECDGCYGACPEHAITRLGRAGYLINYDQCTGCQACVLQCPCNAMAMVPAEVAP
jgi:NADPH-dependent glutamate synthase beta subunit-like oxidoreductase